MVLGNSVGGQSEVLRHPSRDVCSCEQDRSAFQA